MFVTAYGGNMAWKLEADVILITPTKMNKGDVTIEDVVFLNSKGDILEEKRKPTGECPMYLKFFSERLDIKSILHCRPPCVCSFAILKDEDLLMRPYYPETVTEVGPVPTVPYAEPLTQQLADNFSPVLQKYNSFIMENHGLVTMSVGSGVELKEMSKEAVTNLGNVMKIRGLPLFGAPNVNKSIEGMYF